MNNKFKVLLFVLVFTLLAVSLTACAAPEVDTAAQEAAEKAAAEAQAKLEEMEAQLAEAQAAAEEAGSATEEELAAAKAALEEAEAAAAEAAAEAEAAAAAAAEAEAAMANEEVTFLTWYQYDETNEDPASDERVGNEWLRGNIDQFNEEFDGKWNMENRFKPWDRMYQELVSAVIAGNTVPDIIEMGDQPLRLAVKNGAVQDLTEWAMQQEWYDDMDPSAMATCTIDGKLYCIPLVLRPAVTYVWADHFPNGYPKTTDEFVVEAERLKGEGVFAWTYFGSTAYSGNGAGRMLWSLVSSFGGTYDDGEGNLFLTSPETLAAAEFWRMTVMEGYNPETVFAGGFVEEDSFKDASAASIPTGLFGYRYINPLTAPDGTAYSKGSADDMLDAIADGKVILAPMFTAEGKTPGCNAGIQGLSIPVGANNVEAAYDYINWVMTPEQNPAFVLGPGAGFPANTAMLGTPELDLPFYLAAEEALKDSICTPPYGSLDRWEEAQEIIMNAFYKVVKEDPTADIMTVFTEAEEAYNAGN
jgi:multiple sugar transport system substrate-binding protein